MSVQGSNTRHMYSEEKIAAKYAELADAKLVEIAIDESTGLLPEAREILISEITKRGLGAEFIDFIESANKKISAQKQQEIIARIKELPCPNCQKNNKPLYGFEYSKVVSFLFLIHSARREQVLCMRCGVKKKFLALFITLFTGWWSKRGIILTPFTLFKDTINFLFIKKLSRKILHRIVQDYTPTINKSGSNPEQLQTIIVARNKLKDIPEQDSFR